MQGKRLDLSGRTYGHLRVLAPLLPHKLGSHTRWLCECTCGNITTPQSSKLSGGRALSCGCGGRTKLVDGGRTKLVDGVKYFLCAACKEFLIAQKFFFRTRDKPTTCKLCAHARHKSNPAHQMLRSAKTRAKCQGLPFNIDISDCVAPKYCPVLGLELAVSDSGQKTYNSPSLDKIVPALGYVKGNVQVISMRANSLKTDATLDELEKVVAYLRTHVRSQ